MSEEAVDQPVTASADPLLDVDDIAALRVVRRSTSQAPARVELRSAVIDRLIGAQSLLPREFRLLVVAGFACPRSADHRTGGAVDVGVQVEGSAAASRWPATAPPGWDTVAAALSAVGLVDTADAWWHWSYGDERWRSRTGAAAARYTAGL